LATPNEGDSDAFMPAMALMRSAIRSTLPVLAAGLTCAFTLVPFAAHADSSVVSDTLEDVKLYFTAPIRWDGDDWLAFAGSLAAIGVAHEFDARVRDHFATGSNAVLNGGQDKNAVRDALPTVAIIGGTFLSAAFLGDSDGYRESWSLVEAGALSTVTGEALSYAAGRERPDGTTSPNSWRAGGDSFPSVHASAAFAVGTVFAESGNDEYRWIRRIIGYGVAGATAYIRVKENVHWTSDTVAGAALGIATARFVLNRREHPDVRTSFDIEPTKNGWQAGYSVQFR
jgi:membrane-associated phospholipid phosphatase